jgi:hypothetical protein
MFNGKEDRDDKEERIRIASEKSASAVKREAKAKELGAKAKELESKAKEYNTESKFASFPEEPIVKDELFEPYAKEIYDAYRIKEQNPNSFPLSLKMNRLTYITTKMINTLLDWINEIIIIYGLPRVYLYTTINYLKRFINNEPGIRRGKIQLAGAVCLILAIKFDDRYPEADVGTGTLITDITDFIPYITDNSSTAKDAVEMEIRIVISLNYEFNIPTPEYFFDIYKTLIPLTGEEREKSKFLLEFPNFRYVETYIQSLIALASILVSKNIDYADLPEDIKAFINLDEYHRTLLPIYIRELNHFYAEKFNGNYKDSLDKLFK